MMLALFMAMVSPSEGHGPSSPCALAITHLQGSNAPELSLASKACEEEGREDDAVFLDVLTRIRASADLILLPPKDMASLFERRGFTAIIANQSQFADEELARDPKRFAALVQRVREADFSIPADYNPGWTIAESEKRALYAEVIDGLRTDTLAIESYISGLVRDDAYFAAYRERQTILAGLSRDGAELPERYGELATVMQARVDVLGDPPTETAVPWREVYAPGPKAPFTVLHRGFNGPEQEETALFRSATELRQSWVAQALSHEEFAQVLSRVDFESEVVGLYAVGEMPNATENLFVTEFGPREDFDGHSIAVRLGVVGEHCGFEPSRSYPFVLVKASSQRKEGLNSTSRANYPDQCGPVMAGKPTTQSP